MKAIILAAGRGTRMQPISDAIPKEMLPAYDKPIIRLVLDELAEGGVTEVAAITSADKPQLEHYLVGEGVRCIRQGEVGGTGGAVLAAYRSGFAKGVPLVVRYGDDVLQGGSPCTELIGAYEQHLTNAITLLVPVSADAICAYGRAEVARRIDDRVVAIRRITEKPMPEDKTSDGSLCAASVAGCVLPPGAEGVLEGMALERARPSLSDALGRYASKGRLAGMWAQCRYYDCGSFQGWAELFNARAEGRNR